MWVEKGRSMVLKPSGSLLVLISSYNNSLQIQEKVETVLMPNGGATLFEPSTTSSLGHHM